MRKIGAVLIILSMTLPLYAEGGGESATMEPERGIWIWGVPRGPFEGELLDVSNEWALEKFGITVDRVDKVPTGQTADQALQLLIAQDQFPDLMWNMPFTTMAALAAGGRLLPLDKYFRDSVNYPIIASACQSYMSKYKVNGQIYGLPGWEWAVKCEDVSMDVLWYIRKDLYEEHGNPQTTDELLDLLRAVKASGLTDLNGDPVIPFQWRSAWSPVNSRVIYQLKGAGWEVDAESRLLPEWASVETYEAFKFLNLLWNEDLLGKGQFIMDTAGFQDLLKTASIAVATGEPWYASLITDVVPALIEEHGRDAPQTQAALDSQLLIMANPIKDAPGRIVNKQPNPSLVSADIPKPRRSDELHPVAHDRRGPDLQHVRGRLPGRALGLRGGTRGVAHEAGAAGQASPRHASDRQLAGLGRDHHSGGTAAAGDAARALVRHAELRLVAAAAHLPQPAVGARDGHRPRARRRSVGRGERDPVVFRSSRWRCRRARRRRWPRPWSGSTPLSRGWLPPATSRPTTTPFLPA